jgi:glutamate synthase (NADPH/NADH) large chain
MQTATGNTLSKDDPMQQESGEAFVAAWDANVAALSGSYHPSMEHDACGVGLVAALDGQKRRDIVEAGIAALRAVWHRGAVDADGKTGDGAGIHIEIPQDFFADAIERTGNKPDGGLIAVGMVFLPKTDLNAQERCRQIVESQILAFGYAIYGWRQVPIDTACIGEKANATRPEIEQIMIRNLRGSTEADFERELYVIRRRIEKHVIAAQIGEFYMCSLSCRSLIYKGMFLAENLTDFYPDLLDARFVSRFAIYHQRYSTNTFPTWKLAQPFRKLAHNGEINTVSGNTNWMKSHETRLADPSLDPYMDDIKPVIQAGGSDTATLDNVFELLTFSGRDAPMAKALLVPAAIASGQEMKAEHNAMFQYCNAVMEPWDGPAAICGTDGRWVIAGLDRNGLRPLRYTVTASKMLVVGSETGMVKITEARREATLQRRRPARSALRAPGFRRVGQGHPSYRQHRAQRRHRADLLVRRGAAPPSDRRRHHARRTRDDPAPDGRRRHGGDRQHGRRHPAGGIVRALSRPVALFPPGLQPGHQPADR